MVSAYAADGRPRTFTFTNDMSGQTIRRDEQDYTSTTVGDPHEVWYRYGGKQIGYTGNNGTFDTDYLSSTGNRTRTQSTTAFQFTYASPVADFDLSLEPITSFSQGSEAGSYTARAGDTLERIAANLWGDGSLWYMIAAANGLSGPGALSAGQTIVIPSGVMKSHHSASTFKPYDPAEVLGNTNPTSPKPPKKAGGCGMVGVILMIAIAVAVSVVTAGAAVAAVVGGATAGDRRQESSSRSRASHSRLMLSSRRNCSRSLMLSRMK